MGNSATALVVVIPRTAAAANATKTTKEEVKTMEGEIGRLRMALLVVIPKTAEAANATKTTTEEADQERGAVLVALLTRPSPA